MDTTATIESVPKLCPMCHRALGQTAWCAVCAGHKDSSRVDAIRDAENHVRSAMRELGRLTVTIDAYSCDDRFGQDNQATRAFDELTQALEALAGAGIVPGLGAL